jgi:hypothetical protein
MLADFLEYITVVCVFHHDTKTRIKIKTLPKGAAGLIEESMLV